VQAPYNLVSSRLLLIFGKQCCDLAYYEIEFVHAHAAYLSHAKKWVSSCSERSAH